MKRIILIIVAAGICAGAIGWMINRTKGTGTATLAVSATYYPLYDFAKQIGGEHVHVTNLTPAGVEPHDFDPSPKVLARAQGAPVFLYSGAGMEPWVPSFLRDYSGVAAKASSGIELRSMTDESSGQKVVDPHFWLDPVHAQQMVRTIERTMKGVDPENAAAYAHNAEGLIAKLQALDTAYKTQLTTCQTRSIVASHNAFSYLAARYAFDVTAISGMSAEEEPSARHLADIARLVRQQRIKYIFFEHLVSPRLADTIAAETGTKTLVFDPIEGVTDEQAASGEDYLSIQRQNLANLRTALACQ